MEMTDLDHFTGGVPAKVIFEMNIRELTKIIELCISDECAHTKALEICFIGLIAYFEAFMKDHFASIINICPELLKELSIKGQDVGINSADLLLLKHNHINRIGFLVAEKYDFGTPKKINSLYSALLRVTPFGKKEKETFEHLLNDRNLIVHHGGIYSLAYSKQNHIESDIPRNVFYFSLNVGKKRFQEALEDVQQVVNKTAIATHSKLSEYIFENKIDMNSERQKALDALIWSL